MTYPALTALYAGLFALLYVALSLRVSAGRFGFRILHGDGGDERLNRRIRAHGNFAEYVPFILLLAALLEAGGTARVTIHALLAPLLVARILHPFGMTAPVNTPRQFLCRGLPIIVTWAVLAVAGILLLARAA